MKSALKLYRSLPRRDSTARSAVTIGNFDGVHLGHQAILHRLNEAARQHGLSSCVMTFTPHPRAFFAQRGQRPELIPTQISGLRDKVEALRQCGIEQIYLARFNQDMADMSAAAFIEDILVRGLNTGWLLVGEDFRYGHKRAGDIAMLREAGRRHGFEVETLQDVPDADGRRISSSEVRTALAVGQLDRARALLGKPFHISGHVIHGQKLGRDIGYPTLNIRVPEHCAARSGVYVVLAHGLDARPMPGIASLGGRPTVQDQGRLLLEVHLLDRQLNAYGKLARIEFLEFVRDEEKFPDLITMIAAIDNDAQRARDYFASNGL
ncbi:bifunctional riboflavin kinase/FAD synthetase [Alcaligenes sp. Marseille-Q7550]